MASQINRKQFYGLSYFIINKTLKKANKGLLVQTIPPELSLINKSSTSRWERYLKTETKEHKVSTQHSDLANAAKPWVVLNWLGVKRNLQADSPKDFYLDSNHTERIRKYFVIISPTI